MFWTYGVSLFARLFVVCFFSLLSFSPGFEMKVVSTVLLKFRTKSKHLIALVKKMGTQKFGKLKVFPAVGDCGKTTPY